MIGCSLRTMCAAVLFAACGSAANAMFVTSTASTTDTVPEATAAAGGFAGNDVGSMGTGLINLITNDVFATGSTMWAYVGQSDEANTPFSNNPEGAVTGTLMFSEPQDGPFAISIKANDFYSLYFFDETFQGVTEIAFTTQGVAENPGNGNSPGFSHGTLYRLVPAPGAGAFFAGAGLMAIRRRR